MMLAVLSPPGSLNKIIFSLIHERHKTPDVFLLQKLRAKTPAVRYMKLEHPHSENSPYREKTVKLTKNILGVASLFS